MSDPTNWLSRDHRAAGRQILEECRAEHAPATVRRRVLEVTRASLGMASVAVVGTAEAAVAVNNASSGSGIGAGSSALTAGGAGATPLALGAVSAGGAVAVGGATSSATGLAGAAGGAGSSAAVLSAGAASAGAVAPLGMQVGAGAAATVAGAKAGTGIVASTIGGLASITGSVTSAVSSAVALKIGVGAVLLLGGTYLGATTTPHESQMPRLSDGVRVEAPVAAERGARATTANRAGVSVGNSDGRDRPSRYGLSSSRDAAGIFEPTDLAREEPDGARHEMRRVDSSQGRRARGEQSEGRAVAGRSTTRAAAVALDPAADHEVSVAMGGTSAASRGASGTISTRTISTSTNAPTAGAAVRASAGSSSALGDELTLIKQARLALRRGQLEQAELALRTHAERYPSGALGPEAKQLRRRLRTVLARR